MKLLERSSPRFIRGFFTLVALIVILLTGMNFLDVMIYKATSNDQCGWLERRDGKPGALIVDVVPGGVTDRAGVRNGDILLAINGKTFTHPFQAMNIINPLPPGTFVTYLIERDGEQFEAQVEILKVINVQYVAFFLLGMTFLFVGYVVVMTRPQGRVQRSFGIFTLFCMLSFGLMSVSINPNQDPWWKFYPLALSIGFSRAVAPAVFVLFFLTFPFRHRIAEKRWFVWTLIGLGLLVTGTLFFGLGSSLPQPVVQVMAMVPLLSFVTGLFIFIHSYFKHVEKEKREQLRPILISIVIGISVFAYIVVLNAADPFVLFTKPFLLTPTVLIALVPAAFGYSIFRYRLMDIDLLLKRSLIYGAVTASIAAIYIVTVYGIGSLIAYFLGTEENRTLNIVALVIIAFAVDPLKRRFQEWVDRIFYQERYNYHAALREFSQELPRLMNLEQILHSLVNTISSVMHLEKVAVTLCDVQEGCYTISKGLDQRCCQFEEASNGLLALLRNSRAPQYVGLLATDSESIRIHEDDKQKILEAGIVLVVPMVLKDRLIGLIAVGPKRSEKVYSQEDIDLLSTVGSQAAVAIENARLHRSEIERQKIEEELALARRIQQGLLPDASPVIEGLDITGVSIPALTVGGDYFDFIQLGPKKVLVVVADVSGKGMSAALYMSKVQGMIQLAAHMYDSPQEILVHVNRRIYDGIERKSFITMILAMFDLEKREVKICRAGHNKALIASNGSLEYLQAEGIGLGLERGPVFESRLQEVRRSLNEGDLFVFYTDGLTEAMNPLHEQFGEEAVRHVVASRRSLNAQQLQHSIITAVEEFRGPAEPHDDLTLVVAKAR
ncbi:MAG TPA: SpoIIE family protein phosphatase [Bacteroidota bacterium]|nr:SpoIIE family protein phosphatase [Bacteroidota bacterium]